MAKIEFSKEELDILVQALVLFGYNDLFPVYAETEATQVARSLACRLYSKDLPLKDIYYFSDSAAVSLLEKNFPQIKKLSVEDLVREVNF
jgi:hypothetical protein